MTEELPFVSIITCSYKRAKFLPNIMKMVSIQDYPHDKMEWVIMDDSPESSEHLFPENKNLDGIQVRYYYFKQKVPLARKRDLLNHAAKGKYLINMDDDDYYPPCRVSHAVSVLMEKGTPLVGTSLMYMYFSRDKSIYRLGPYRDNHGTAATLAYTKEFANTHFYYDPNCKNGKGHFAEEGVFTEGWKYPMAQLDPFKTVLALSHTDNTIEKTMFIEKKYGHLGHTVHETNFTLDRFINKTNEQSVYDFYNSLEYEYRENEFTGTVKTKMEENSYKAITQYSKHMAERMVSELKVAHVNLKKKSMYQEGIRI